MTNLPVSGIFNVTAVFGQTGKYWSNGHQGIDLVAVNKNVYATCDGVVRVVAYDDGGWGQYVTIGENNGCIHIFCHLVKGSVLVKTGQKVTRSTVLGIMGSTGNVSGVHLHYQINLDGKAINPTPYMGIPNKMGTYNSKDYTIKETTQMTYTNFKDDGKISCWAKAAVKEVFDAGIMIGDNNGNFNPKDSLTREELAVVIARLLKK